MKIERYINFNNVKAVFMILVVIAVITLVESDSISETFNCGNKSELQANVLDEFLFLADGAAEVLMKELSDSTGPF